MHFISMKTIGIIAEYNPFHNGHAYQIAEIKKRTGAEFVVAAMSGNFVQRGAPAIVDKYTRTQMALSCGADLVIELPVLWATASAESFAMAGITLFEKTGCIDAICFGAETDHLPLLTGISDILCNEPELYRAALSDFLKQGMNFPLARARALTHFLSTVENTDMSYPSGQFQQAGTGTLMQILSSPNNILALEYLKALKRRHSAIKPLLLKREGAGYHDGSIKQNNSMELKGSMEPFCASATAIRMLLHKCAFPMQSAEDMTSLENAVPGPVLEIFCSYFNEYPAIEADDFSSILGYRLLALTPEGFAGIADTGPALNNRFSNFKYQYESFTQFCELNKSREITYTRISRALLHLILDITEADINLGKQADYIPYLRILGFKKSSAGLLTLLKENAAVPLIAKLADARRQLSREALAILDMDISAAELYEMVKTVKYHRISQKERTTPRNEYSRGIVLVP